MDDESSVKCMKVVGCVLHQMFGPIAATLRTAESPATTTGATAFHSQTAPVISIESYFARLAQYQLCPAECWILALAHLSRLVQRNPTVVNGLSIHRLLLTALLCAAKEYDDQPFNNASFAFVGGVSVKEMNRLEVEFLTLIDFNLFVPPAAYAQLCRDLCHPSHHQHCDCTLSGIDLHLYDCEVEAETEAECQRKTTPASPTSNSKGAAVAAADLEADRAAQPAVVSARAVCDGAGTIRGEHTTGSTPSAPAIRASASCTHSALPSLASAQPFAGKRTTADPATRSLPLSKTLAHAAATATVGCALALPTQGISACAAPQITAVSTAMCAERKARGPPVVGLTQTQRLAMSKALTAARSMHWQRPVRLWSVHHSSSPWPSNTFCTRRCSSAPSQRTGCHVAHSEWSSRSTDSRNNER